MSESQHPDATWNDPRITAYTLGELSPEEIAQFESEMASNPSLAAAVDEARALTDQLKSLFASETTPALDAERRDSILAQSAAVSYNRLNDSRLNDKPWWKRRWVELAVAASLIFIVIGLSLPVVNSPRMATLSTGERATQQAPVSDFQSPDAAVEAGDEESLRYQRPFAIEPDSSEPYSSAPEMAGDAEDLQNVMSDHPFGEGAGGSANRSMMLEKQASTDLESLALPANAPSAAAPVMTSEGARSVASAVPDSPALRSDSARRRAVASAPGGMGGGGRYAPKSQSAGVALDEFAHSQPDTPTSDTTDEGRGPGIAGDRFDLITDNAFKRVSEHPLSTFSIDVDTASYSKIRSFLNRSGMLPRPDAVRIEEMINYFDYAYEIPAADSEHPLVARAEVVSCPWNEGHRLARIALKGKTLESEKRPPCNLVFLLDTSGSMDAANKLPLVREGMKLLLSKLGAQDRVAIVVYAGSAGLVLESTPASEDAKIRRALTELAAGGSTNGGAGIALAYQTARDNFIKEGVNRVILCTDGDFNVGTTGTDSLVRLVEAESKGGIFLTVLGFGMGNHNDAMLEQISGKGNGTYAYIDTINEARRVLVDQTDSTLVTIAKDVKLQVEFNPARVAAYRLIGYENRILAKEDFNDDKKDAGEIGAGHTVTALYEIVPAGKETDAIAPPVDELKYQKPVTLTDAAGSQEVITIKMRYKDPDSDTSKLVEFPVADEGKSFEQADVDVRFAAAVAAFGMKLRKSPYGGNWTFTDIEKTAEAAIGEDPYGLRAELVELVRKAATLSVQNEGAGTVAP